MRSPRSLLVSRLNKPRVPQPIFIAKVLQPRSFCGLLWRAITPIKRQYRQMPGLTWSAPHGGGRWCRAAPRRALRNPVLPPAQRTPPCRRSRARSPAVRCPRHAAYLRAGGCRGARETSAGSTSTTRPPHHPDRRPAPLSP